MACGERFAFLLPPPCEGWVGLGAVCTGEDYEVAREHVAEIRRLLIRSWNELWEIEDAAGAHEVTERWRMDHDAWLGRYDELGWQFFATRSDFEVLDMLARDGICLLDRMVEDAEATHGDAVTAPEAPFVPPPKPTTLDKLSDIGQSAVTLAVIAVLGYAAYQVWDRYG